MAQQTDVSPIKKGGDKMKEDYKRIYKDRTTGQIKVYYSNYRYEYKEYNQVKKIAFILMQQYNNKLYNNKEIDYNNKNFITYKEALKRVLQLPKQEVLAAIETYNNKQQLKREAKVYQRLQQLEEAEQKANKYFTTVQLKKEQSLIRFIEGIKQGDPKALELFRAMTPEQQEETVNKVDNYLYKQSHQEVEVQLDYIENLGGEE